MKNRYLLPQVYLYMRFSKKRQEDGDSLRRQMKLAEETSKKHNIPINEDLIMRDRGLSAFKAEHIKRGALGKFIAAIEDGLIAEGSILIVESMDRLSRDTPLAAQIQFNILMSKGITVITANDGLTYNEATLATESSKLFLIMGSMQRAHDESKHKHIRSLEAIEAKIQAFKEGAKPKSVGGDPHWIKTQDGYLQLDQERADIVKLIVDMYLKEHKGLNLIARELTKRGYSTPSGKRKAWGATTIRKILDNKALYGHKKFSLTYLKNGRYIAEPPYELDDYYPPIITKEEYDIIQVRKGNTSGSRESYGEDENVYLLSAYGKGKSVCAHCGKNTHTQYQKQKNRKNEYTGRNVQRLHCGSHKESSDCQPSFICQELEMAFIRAICTHINPQFLEKENAGKIDEERLRKDISILDAKIDALLKSIDELDSIDIIMKIKEKIRAFDLEKKELSGLLNQSYDHQTGAEDFHKMRELAEKCIDIKNSNERRTFKKILLQSIDKITINFEEKSLTAQFMNGNNFSLGKDGQGIYQTVTFYKRRPKNH